VSSGSSATPTPTDERRARPDIDLVVAGDDAYNAFTSTAESKSSNKARLDRRARYDRGLCTRQSVIAGHQRAGRPPPPPPPPS